MGDGSWTAGPFVLGTGNFGGDGGELDRVGQGHDESAAFAMMDEAVDLGITSFDTASRYALGSGEAMIGRWLRDRPDATTSRVRLATKVAPRWLDHAPGPFDEAWVDAMLTGSLQRLGVAAVDVLWTHAPDDHEMRPAAAGEPTPVETTLEALEAVRESGRCRLLGASNVTADQLRTAVAAADRLGVAGYEAVQNPFNLLDRDDEVQAVAREHGLAYTSHSPLATGILVGKYRRGAPPPHDSRLAEQPDMAEWLSDDVHDALDVLRAAAADLGVAPGALALAWQLAHPDVTAVTVGPARTARHLDLVEQARTCPVDDDLATELSEAFSLAT